MRAGSWEPSTLGGDALSDQARPERSTSAHPSGDQRFALLDTALRRARYEPHQLIEILHTAQEIFGHLSDDVLVYVAQGLRLPRARVLGVATFYHLFRFEPAGDHTCSVCTGTACFVKGADRIIDALQRAHGVLSGETTDDGRLSLSTARCIGSCGLAPLIVVDGEILGKMDASRALEEIATRLDTADAPATDAAGEDATTRAPGDDATSGTAGEGASAGSSGQQAVAVGATGRTVEER
jgi:bidirectional [NiFe] hydrogenase diaphorase subunit